MKKNLYKSHEILSEYYLETYTEYIDNNKMINFANEFLEKKLERTSRKTDKFVLEIGGGGGGI